jgi:hypothetical protein
VFAGNRITFTGCARSVISALLLFLLLFSGARQSYQLPLVPQRRHKNELEAPRHVFLSHEAGLRERSQRRAYLPRV